MFAKILGTNISYEITGDGPPILFVHGLGGTGNVWNAQRQGLAKFFKVITIDLPGSGRSDKIEKSYSMERWADQVMALADALKLDKLTLAGHSMATIAAQKAAAKYGPRLHALVLCGPLTELTSAGKEAFVKRADSVLKEGMTAVADAVLGGALSAATREANPVLAGLYREMLLANDPAAYAAQCQALINGSAPARPAQHQMPYAYPLGGPGRRDAPEHGPRHRRRYRKLRDSHHPRHCPSHDGRASGDLQRRSSNFWRNLNVALFTSEEGGPMMSSGNGGSQASSILTAWTSWLRAGIMILLIHTGEPQRPASEQPAGPGIAAIRVISIATAKQPITMPASIWNSTA